MSQIEGSAVLDIRDLVAATLKTNTDIPSVVVPEGFDVKSLESLQVAPSRIRQITNLISPGSLIAYIQRFRDARSVVFADKTKTQIVAVLDFHQNAEAPHWGMHKAVYNCPFSDEWKAWTAADSNKMNQIDFAEFLENNIQNVAPVGDNYSGPSGTELLEMVLAFQETRKVEFKSVKRLQDGTCQFQYSDDKSGSGNTKIPEKISLAIAPFHNGAPYQIDARIRYRLRDGQLVLWYELIEPKKIVEHAFQEIVTDMENQLGEDLPIYEGSI
ncbi:YfdQ family protein [Klebsiella variicola]|uniref:YfdQ family protein n=1 Tax=Klebsiella variicola TaxID=244366 RepID=UPI00398278F3